MTDEKYWNELYYKELENVEPDFLKDIYLEKKKEIIDKVENKKCRFVKQKLQSNDKPTIDYFSLLK